MPGNDLNITLPNVGDPGPTYATLIRAAFVTIITDLEAKITPDEIDVNANLDFSSGVDSYGAINLAKIAFTAQSSTLSASNPLSLYSTDGELYYQDDAGNNVPITSAGQVNAASTGAINTSGSPAYGSSGVEVIWNGTTGTYTFKSGSGADTLADIVSDTILLGNGANRTTLDTAVTSDYTLTFPAGQAAANDSVFTVSTSGAITFTRDLDIDTVATTGDITATGDLEASQNFFSGTEDICFSAFDMITQASSWSGSPTGASAAASIWTANASGPTGAPLVIPLSMLLDKTDITNIEFYYGVGSALGSAWTLEIKSMPPAAGSASFTTEDSDSFTPGLTSSISSPAVRVWAPTSVSIDDSRIYFLVITVPTDTSYQRDVIGVIMTVTRPND